MELTIPKCLCKQIKEVNKKEPRFYFYKFGVELGLLIGLRLPVAMDIAYEI